MTAPTTAYDRLLDALRGAGKSVTVNGNRAMAQCPAHDDRKPSLSVTRTEGRTLMYCHGGCDVVDVLAALNCTKADLFDEPFTSRKWGTVYAEYRYPGGRKVWRTADKQFPQPGNNKDRSLYHADRIGDAATVYVVEGEEDVHAVEAAGGVAVCSAMGAGKAHLADWSPLAGRQVIIVADKDQPHSDGKQPGRDHALSEAGLLLDGIAATATIVAAAVGKDASDHIAAGKALDELVPVDWWPREPEDGAELLDDLVTWWRRFIAVTNPDDLYLLALWTVHTHLVSECYTTPRLLIDSIMEGSGKTTVIDHLNRLCVHPVQAATISSPALIPRLLENGMRTILIDEAHRALRPDRPGVEDLIGIINTGYRYGATRPVLVPAKGGGWDASEMPTFAPVAMAGNNPNLAPDTVSRQLRVLLMPDIDGIVEDSDWELLADEVAALRDRVAAFADTVRDDVRGMAVDLPKGCIGRAKEKWRPLARVAEAAGGDWPGIVNRLIVVNMAEEAAEREAGVKTVPPGVVIMTNLHAVWPTWEHFMPTRDLVPKLIEYNPGYWGADSAYGKALTEHRLGRLVSQAAKMTSTRPGGRGPRGYLRVTLEPVWHRLGIGRNESGANGGSGDSGGEEADTTAFAGSTGCTASTKGSSGNERCDSNGSVTGEPTGPLDDEPILFEDEPEPAQQTCACGNSLACAEATNSGKCKPCRDKAMAGNDR